MALTLKLKDFNGPLDMLLFMIGKAKIDPWTLSVGVGYRF